MDTWNEEQLKLMSMGGNKNLFDFFDHYDLNEEGVQTKYNTKAADFYRQMVSLSD